MKEENKIFVFNVVTDKPMAEGQTMQFDETTAVACIRGCWIKPNIVKDIYDDSCKFDAKQLDHHTLVVLRELAIEKVPHVFEILKEINANIV